MNTYASIYQQTIKQTASCCTRTGTSMLIGEASLTADGIVVQSPESKYEIQQLRVKYTSSDIHQAGPWLAAPPSAPGLGGPNAP